MLPSAAYTIAKLRTPNEPIQEQFCPLVCRGNGGVLRLRKLRRADEYLCRSGTDDAGTLA